MTKLIVVDETINPASYAALRGAIKAINETGNQVLIDTFAAVVDELVDRDYLVNKAHTPRKGYLSYNRDLAALRESILTVFRLAQRKTTAPAQLWKAAGENLRTSMEAIVGLGKDKLDVHEFGQLRVMELFRGALAIHAGRSELATTPSIWSYSPEP